MIARGCVISAAGDVVTASLPCAAVGQGVRIRSAHAAVAGVVTAVQNGRAVVAARGEIDGVAAGDEVRTDATAQTMPMGTALLGRCIDSRGVPMDGGPSIAGPRKSINCGAPAPADRGAVEVPFWTGVRALDALLTLGRGGRIGIFGPPGCGKSTLLHALVRGADCDAVVVGLVGERGREAEEWMRVCPQYGSIVCATSDRSAAERIHAARVAFAQADALRSHGLHVLLVLDSLARFAAALREVSVASGQSVGRGGYPPGVFADVARLVEIAGNGPRGSITLVATVLSDGDERDPVSEAARSLLDGHVALSPKLAETGWFPAIDVPASTSRTMNQVASREHRENAELVRAAVASLLRSEDARALGIVPSDAQTLRAMAAEDRIEALLRQGSRPAMPAETLSMLRTLADTLR